MHGRPDDAGLLHPGAGAMSDAMEHEKVPKRLATHLVDAYLIDGSLFCYDCAEQIGMPSVERHIRVRKLECYGCTPNRLAETFMRMLDKEVKEKAQLQEHLIQVRLDRDGWITKYNRAQGVIQRMNNVLSET